MGGSVHILGRPDGRWGLSVNGGKERVFATFDEALLAAGTVTFAPGESPGSWRVRIDRAHAGG